MPVTTARPFTYEDYLLLPEDRRYEIIGGELFLTPAPTPRHQIVVSNLQYALESFVRQRRLGVVLPSPCGVVLSATDIVQPDLSFVSVERASIVGEKHVSAAPDLVIEVLSPGTAERDQTLKAKTYERYGARELWIVSPEARTIEVLVNREGGFSREAIYGFGDRLKSPLLPGLEIPLESVF